MAVNSLGPCMDPTPTTSRDLKLQPLTSVNNESHMNLITKRTIADNVSSEDEMCNSKTKYDISTEQEMGTPAFYVQQCSEDDDVPKSGETANLNFVVNHNDQSYQQVLTVYIDFYICVRILYDC